jgi:hypothetical protein
MTSNRNVNVPHIKLSIRLKQQATSNSQSSRRDISKPTSSANKHEAAMFTIGSSEVLSPQGSLREEMMFVGTLPTTNTPTDRLVFIPVSTLENVSPVVEEEIKIQDDLKALMVDEV